MENSMSKVKELRKVVGMKQYILAKHLGIEQSNYTNLENGKLALNRLPEIKQKAIHILLPILKEKIDSIKLELDYAVKLDNQIKEEYNKINLI